MTIEDPKDLARELHDLHAERIVDEWKALLNSDPDETQLQAFLEQYPMLLPGAKGDIGAGGHHGPIYGAVVREAPLQGLQTNRRPDFMWITKATDLLTPICIEIEKPSKRWFRQDGSQHADFTQAQGQLAQWRGWFKEPENELWFRRTYLNGEFPNLRIEPQFVLVHGRQSEFEDSSIKTPVAERLKVRRDWAREDEHLRTFDSLYYEPLLESDVSMMVHDNGVREVYKIPPTFTWSGFPRGPYVLGDPTEAIARSVVETRDRSESITKLWKEQAEEGWRLSNGMTHRPIPGLSPWGDPSPTAADATQEADDSRQDGGVPETER